MKAWPEKINSSNVKNRSGPFKDAKTVFMFRMAVGQFQTIEWFCLVGNSKLKLCKLNSIPFQAVSSLDNPKHDEKKRNPNFTCCPEEWLKALNWKNSHGQFLLKIRMLHMLLVVASDLHQTFKGVWITDQNKFFFGKHFPQNHRLSICYKKPAQTFGFGKKFRRQKRLEEIRIVEQWLQMIRIKLAFFQWETHGEFRKSRI